MWLIILKLELFWKVTSGLGHPVNKVRGKELFQTLQRAYCYDLLTYSVTKFHSLKVISNFLLEKMKWPRFIPTLCLKENVIHCIQIYNADISQCNLQGSISQLSHWSAEITEFYSTVILCNKSKFFTCAAPAIILILEIDCNLILRSKWE